MRSDRTCSPLTLAKVRTDLDRYKMQLTIEDVKNDFDAFCNDYGFNKTTLGLQAVGDGAFRDRLAKGASSSLKRITELYKFMHAHVEMQHREMLNGIIG